MIYSYILIVNMFIIAIYSIILLGILLKAKVKRYYCKFVYGLEDAKLLYRKLKPVITLNFSIRKISVKKIEAKLRHELLKKPSAIFAMLSMAVMFLALVLPSIIILGKSTKEIVYITALISFFIFILIIVTVKVPKTKTLVMLRMFYLYSALPVIAITNIYLLILINGNSKLKISSVAISVIFFMIYGVFIFYICHRDVKSKFLRLALSLPIYIAILLFSSFIFGAYYYSTFNDLEKINSTNSIVIIKVYSKLGFSFFYSYIDGVHYNKVTLCQYYFGKFLDIFMLGYIFNKLTEKKVIKKKISTKEELYREDLKQRTKIIKKIRDINIKKMKNRKAISSTH